MASSQHQHSEQQRHQRNRSHQHLKRNMFGRKYLWVLLLIVDQNSLLCSSFCITNHDRALRWRTKTNNHSAEELERPIHQGISKQIGSVFLASVIAISASCPAFANTINMLDSAEEVQGMSAVTQSQIGKSVRRTIIGGAQLADSIDLKWERFSDSLRDEQKCDPRTNRRMFDNGTRKDGTKIGNPVLGALCTPEPLQMFDSQFAAAVLDLAQDSARDTLGMNLSEIQRKEEQTKEKVGAAFSRAATTSGLSDEENTQELKRQNFNRDQYIRMRAYGELMKNRETARALERSWGNNLLAKLAPNANRNDYKSPFPKPDPTDEQPYDEGALLDALGCISVALNKLQDGGLIGHWEISIPEDDYWNVATIAVDDDISIGGQILSRESNQQFLKGGSPVVALVRSAIEDKAKISYKIDTFFIDPTTTKQELYNPTQLLISLSDLGV